MDLEKNEIHQSTNSTYSWVHNLAKPFLSPINTTRTVKFKDYCPHVFARIRDAFGISASSYIQSLRSTAKEKLSEGASGAFMFFTKDGKVTPTFKLYKTFSTDGGLTWSFPEVVYQTRISNRARSFLDREKLLP